MQKGTTSSTAASTTSGSKQSLTTTQAQPSIWLTIKVYLLAFCTLGIAFTIILVSQQLPKPLDENANPKLFSEGRAKKHLQHLTETIGRRLVGTNGLDETVNYIIQELKRITPIEGGPVIEISVQNTTGSMNMDWLKVPITSVFTNITNIVVRVSPPATKHAATSPSDVTLIHTTQKDMIIKSDVDLGYVENHHNYLLEGHRNSILVSSHFDSAISSFGAFDDGVATVVMLEIVRVLASHKALATPIIFNFNGAEEPGLQAAFGFIAQHPWAKDVRVSVNLEAGGCGGRASVVQFGPSNSWLINSYVKSVQVPRLSYSVKDLFKAVPADTDFNVYRNFANIPGLDIAFTGNGHLYHTPYDSLETVNNFNGSITHMGDITLSVIRSLSNNYLGKPDKMKKLDVYEEWVFFDVLGWFVVTYSTDFGLRVYFGYLIVVATAVVLKIFSLEPHYRGNYILSVAISCIGIVVSLVLGILSSVVVASIVIFGIGSQMQTRMSWLAKPHLAFLMYGSPCYIAMLLVQAFLQPFLKTLLARRFPQVTANMLLFQTNNNNYGSSTAVVNEPSKAAMQHDVLELCESAVFWASSIISGVLIVTTTVLDSASAFIWYFLSVIPIAIRSTATVIKTVFGTSKSVSTTIHYIQYVISFFITGLFILYNFYIINEAFYGVLTRAGSVVELDIVFAAAVSIFTFFTLYMTLPLTQRASNFSFVIAILFSICFVATGISIYSQTPVVNPKTGETVLIPYTKDYPKRLLSQHVYHLDQQGLVQESYIMVGALDSILVQDLKNPYFEDYVVATQEMIDRDLNHVHPINTFIAAIHLKNNSFKATPGVPKPKPRVEPTISVLRDDVDVLLEEEEEMFVATRRLNLTVHTGEAHCMGALMFKAHGIISWSLTKTMPPHTLPDTYVIRKIGEGDFDFVLTFRETIFKYQQPVLYEKLSKHKEQLNEDVKREIFGTFNIQQSTACWHDMSPALKEINDNLPDWIARDTVAETFIRFYDF